MHGIKMKLSRLEELVLHIAHESDDILNELMLSCPTLRLVELIRRSRSRDLLICGSKLETFEASAMLHNDSFSISAPNLISFSYLSIFIMAFSDGQLSNLQVHGARNLRELAGFVCAHNQDNQRSHLTASSPRDLEAQGEPVHQAHQDNSQESQAPRLDRIRLPNKSKDPNS
ncbi:hypothetical protein ACJRO7_026477 [Eucalyptus globulus]|uniref:Uncharacterized protein n=1 Tax=Eucalyptus globulus TaxID=34317 RepID=A0ABD3JT07_EUCGL